MFGEKLDGLEYKMEATLHRELRSQTWKLVALVATAMLGALAPGSDQAL